MCRGVRQPDQHERRGELRQAGGVGALDRLQQALHVVFQRSPLRGVLVVVGNEGVADDAVGLQRYDGAEALGRFGVQAGRAQCIAQRHVDVGVGRRQGSGAQQAAARLAVQAERQFGLAAIQVVGGFGRSRLRRAALEGLQRLAGAVELEQAQTSLQPGAEIVRVELHRQARGIDAARQVTHAKACGRQRRPGRGEAGVHAHRALEVDRRSLPAAVLQMQPGALQPRARVSVAGGCVEHRVELPRRRARSSGRL